MPSLSLPRVPLDNEESDLLGPGDETEKRGTGGEAAGALLALVFVVGERPGVAGEGGGGFLPDEPGV